MSDSEHRLSDIRIQQFLDDWRELPEHIPWSVLRCVVVELAEARAVIAKLPHTKDGVPITVGVDVWGAWQDVGIIEQIHANHVVMRQPGGLFWRLGSECYSTLKAAEAARGEGDRETKRIIGGME